MPGILGNLLVFARLLRRVGIDVHVGRLLDVAEALLHVDIGAREEVYHTCRTLLVHRHEDLVIFDRVFDAFWRDRQDNQGNERLLVSESPEAGDEKPDAIFSETGANAKSHLTVDDSSAGDSPSAGAVRIWSDVHRLAEKDFAEFTPEEVALGRAALESLAWNPGERRTRRWVRGRGPRIDLRRALGQSLRTGGEVVKLPRRQRRSRPRGLVFLCDVSGSMERYSRMLLHFGYVIARRRHRVEAFLFSTKLTRITLQLRTRRLDDAMVAVSRAVPDWSGGTRIGDAIKELHQRWTRQVLHGGPVVLLVSDGWDRGDPSVLRGQIARLQRSCRRLIWLNPLIGTIDYAPMTRGLQAALPFVDDFLPARTLTNLADLARHLNSVDSR
jgi:uncharacterized protein